MFSITQKYSKAMKYFFHYPTPKDFAMGTIEKGMDITDRQTGQKLMMADPKVNIMGFMKPKIEGWILLPSHPTFPCLSQVSLPPLFPL